MFLFFLVNFFLNIFFLSLIFSFFLSFLIIKYFLYFFKKYKILQMVRKNNLNKFFKKKYIPTMGGISFFLVFLLSTFIWVNFLDIHILILILFFVLNFCIGFLDDFLKIYFKNCDGLTILQKFFLQNLSILIFIYLIVLNNLYFDISDIFYIKNYYYRYLYYFLWYFLLICSINAVNFTDGLDGLVIFPLILVFLFLFIVSLFSSNVYIANILNIRYIYYAKDFALMCIIILGSCLSFFYFNFYPAKIFLGDTGSLSIGSLLSAMFILLHKEFYLILVGFIFVIEFISVILQIFYFKFFKKRFFLMAPIHHHYELNNFTEIKIVSFFWIISLISFFLSILFFFSSIL